LSGAGFVASLGNALFGIVGVVVGVIIDGASGATLDPKPNPLQVTLVALAEPEKAPLALAPRTALRVQPAASVTYLPRSALC
jgi:hypothetical protein